MLFKFSVKPQENISKAFSEAQKKIVKINMHFLAKRTYIQKNDPIARVFVFRHI